MSRARLTVPFGGGVDRLSGAAVVDPTAFGLLKNAHLYRGRTEFRTGLQRKLLAGWGTDLLGVFSVQAQGLTALVIYKSSTREVRLYLVDSTFATPTLAGALWTMPASIVGLPAVLGADVYGKLILCHDEPVFNNRQATKVMATDTFSISTFQADLDRTGVVHDCKFRGVIKYLSYAVYWGYGNNTTPDSPHTVRISEPGAPTTLVPEHFEQVGFPGDPVVGCAEVQGGLRMAKIAAAYKLVGTDRKTFGVVPMDEHFGLTQSRLQVTVNGENFHWTLHGPRSSTGGPSLDLAMPLDLTGPDPDDPSEAETEGGRQFAFYDPSQGEVVFVFDYFAFVLHLRDGERRWSYREYGIPLACAGLMYEGGLSIPVVLLPDWTDHGTPLGANAGTTLGHPTDYSATLDRFVSVYSGAAKYSNDGGITWNACTISAKHWYVCKRSDVAGAFVACADDGSVASSVDGITFTDRVSALGTAIWDATYAAGIGFVAVGSSGGIMTSADAGVTWTLRTPASGAHDFESVDWSGTKLLAVGVNCAETSPDGVTWTTQAGLAAGEYPVVRWSPLFNLFVVGSEAATITTTPDGVTFTVQSLPPGVTVRSAMVTALGRGIAVSLGSGAIDAPNTTECLTTLTGTAYLTRTIPQGDNWIGLAYSEARARFVAVSQGGRVMTA